MKRLELEWLVASWLPGKWNAAGIAQVRRELRALLAVARAAEHDHDPRFREIANEDHSACRVCLSLARLRRASAAAGRGERDG